MASQYKKARYSNRYCAQVTSYVDSVYITVRICMFGSGCKGSWRVFFLLLLCVPLFCLPQVVHCGSTMQHLQVTSRRRQKTETTLWIVVVVVASGLQQITAYLVLCPANSQVRCVCACV